MKTNIKSIILLFFIFCITAFAQKQKSFSLIGKTKDIENGTYLKIYDLDNKKIIDSCVVIKNEFTYKNQKLDFPLEIILINEKNNEENRIWLEKEKIYFDSSINGFSNAEIKGSALAIRAKKYKEERDKANIGRDFYKALDFNKLYAKNNPNNELSLALLNIWGTEIDNKELTEIFNLFPKNLQNSKYGKKVSELINFKKDLKIGDKIIDISLKDSKNELINSSDLKGKIILFEFWASWCGPCRASFPELKETYEKYKDKGLEIYAISLDKDYDKWKKAIEKDGLLWLNVCDLSGYDSSVVKTFGINGIPANFLVDENGIIQAKDLRGEILDKKVLELINKK